mmetsp:Transcript_107633/g.303138  ORF Transcript_107633/g.303138 Transcript_107633/m.303138 type:complete len:219 (-) Transcript_107633:326-982(-)
MLLQFSSERRLHALGCLELLAEPRVAQLPLAIQKLHGMLPRLQLDVGQTFPKAVVVLEQEFLVRLGRTRRVLATPRLLLQLARAGALLLDFCEQARRHRRALTAMVRRRWSPRSAALRRGTARVTGAASARSGNLLPQLPLLLPLRQLARLQLLGEDLLLQQLALETRDHLAFLRCGRRQQTRVRRRHRPLGHKHHGGRRSRQPQPPTSATIWIDVLR